MINTIRRPVRRVLTSGRGQFALLLLFMAAAVLALMQYVTTRAPGPEVNIEHLGGTVHFAAARPAVFWNDDCIELRWHVENITEVYLNDTPTVGEGAEPWCLPPPSEYRGFYRDPASAELRVRFNNGAIHRYNVRVYVMQPFIERIVLPLALLAAGVIGTLYLPPRFTAWLARPRPLPAAWKERLARVRWRRWAAWVTLLGAVVAAAVIGYRVALAPSYTRVITVGDASFTVTVTPPVVFGGGDCTAVAWTSEGVGRVSILETDQPLAGELSWCMPLHTSNTIIQFEVESAAGEMQRHAVNIPAAKPMLYYTALPLLLAAVYFTGVHRLLPLAWLERRLANSRLFAPFARDGKLNRVLLALFVVINVITLTNIIRHKYTLAYDGEDHFLYSLILADGRMPTEDETNQFFAPPLVYVFPSLAHRAAVAAGLPACTKHVGQELACQIMGKTAQAQNFIAAVGTTYLLVLVAGIIRPQDDRLKVHALALLAMIPVFYKVMVFHRGEPFVALFTLLLVHRLLVMFPAKRRPTLRDSLIFGLGLGLLVISRQWGVMAAAGVSLWALIAVIQRGRGGLALLLWAGVRGYAVGLMSGGWFYLFTRLHNGAVTAFNRPPEATTSTLALKPLEFYIGLGSGTLFTMPFRSARIAQILPIFYTDLWGDYWGYFYLSSASFSVWSASPPLRPIAYMARVNVVSLLPTALLLMALAFGVMRLYDWLRWKHDDLPTAAYALAQLVILVSLAGYLWFLIQYPHVVGDTIKASYVLQIYPLLALLGGAVLIWLRRWNEALYVALVVMLTLVAAHNVPMLITQYTGA